MSNRHLADKSEWEETGVLGAGRTQSAVVSVRFGSREIEEVRAAARRSGLKTSEFIRRSAVDAATAGGSMTLQIAGLGITLVGPTTETINSAPHIKVA